MDGKPGDLLLFVADQPAVVFESLGRLREELRDRLELIDPDLLGFCWVIDFPLVNWNEDEKRWDPSHHLFTSPMFEDLDLLDEDPSRVRGQQYDLVLNGYEIAGGSIRIHKAELQEKIFELIGLDMDVAREIASVTPGVSQPRRHSIPAPNWRNAPARWSTHCCRTPRTPTRRSP